MAYLNDPKVQEQLTWLTAKVAACTSNCASLTRLKVEVESAITAAARGT